MGGFKGGAWNSEVSARGSWGADVLHVDGKYHGWFNQLPDQCGLSSWLPGSNIAHGISDSPLGPFVPADDVPPPAGQRNPLDQFATNPHVTYIANEKRYLVYFNGRKW